MDVCHMTLTLMATTVTAWVESSVILLRFTGRNVCIRLVVEKIEKYENSRKFTLDSCATSWFACVVYFYNNFFLKWVSSFRCPVFVLCFVANRKYMLRVELLYKTWSCSFGKLPRINETQCWSQSTAIDRECPFCFCVIFSLFNFSSSGCCWRCYSTCYWCTDDDHWPLSRKTSSRTPALSNWICVWVVWVSPQNKN